MRKRVYVLLVTALLLTIWGCGSKEHTHQFNNGVCSECGSTWTSNLYEKGVEKYGCNSYGNSSFYIPVDDEYVYFSLDERTFLIEYEGAVKDDTRTKYCLRTYIDDAGTVIYSDENVEYTIHDSNEKPDKNAPVSDLNIDYTYERYFNEEQDSAEYTYLSTYVCPANELVNAYKTKDVLSGEDPFRLLYSPDYLAYDLYTSSDFARNEVTMNSLFGNKSYITENEFFDMYLSDYERCLSKIDTALAEFGTSLSEYGINYKN